MRRKMLFAMGALIVLAAAVKRGLPMLLSVLGPHPRYDVPPMDVHGRRALIVTTSHDTLGATGKPTGVFASEMTVPYYAFTEAGMVVDIASIDGGPIPIERSSLWKRCSSPKRTAPDRR
jgi:hypothetical protein